MANLKATVRNRKSDGFWQVYIRIVHRNGMGYIKTDKMVSDSDLTKTKEITEPVVLEYCAKRIIEYTKRLNTQEISRWSVSQVVSFLKHCDEDICFSDYARRHAEKMIDAGQRRNARNYVLALQHMERFAGTNKIMFSTLTTHFINEWIKSLANTHRAKEFYPICMRQVFKAAVLDYNDYDTGDIRIKTNPWLKVSIPRPDKAPKLAITPEQCRAFFSAPLPESRFKSPLPEFGRDVALMVLCLAGINTVDLYNLRKEDYRDGVICYNRAKTKKFRADEAYMEIRVPTFLKPTFDKYLCHDEESPWLFNFHERMTSSDSFGANSNTGIRALCKSMGIPKDEDYCCYTFRHTWGTVAQNYCGASIEEVAFAMNHSSAHRVTRGYLKMSFAPAWELNEKVVQYIFMPESAPKSVKADKTEPKDKFRLSPKYMIRATASYKFKVLAEIQDIGFSNVDEVCEQLAAMLPETIPDRAIVQFKIVNMDTSQIWTTEHQKGKGFQ